MEPTDPSIMPTPTPTRRPRLRRALAVAAGVAMVPALYAVAAATTGGGGSPSTVSAASRSADDPAGTETEIEHGVVVEKPHGGAATPSVPESTSPTTPQATTPTTPEQEIEHPVPEPGDDNGVDAPGDDHGNDGGAAAPVPSGTQAFSSVGGSIVIAVNGSSISLVSTSPAAGFSAEVHDNGPSRVEVRFFGSGTNGDTEWRIRIELGGGGLTSEITQHG
ncbi:MAG TPA: hypothetical protein VGN51_20175 [Acidimicrobiia bacterium]|jgi:hypothetical protein